MPSQPKKTIAQTTFRHGELKALADVVEKLHGAKASFIRSVRLTERIQDATVWGDVVSQFALHGHPTAAICYAWCDRTSRQRFYAVLHTAEVDSPEKAVRASVVTDQFRLNR